MAFKHVCSVSVILSVFCWRKMTNRHHHGIARFKTPAFTVHHFQNICNPISLLFSFLLLSTLVVCNHLGCLTWFDQSNIEYLYCSQVIMAAPASNFYCSAVFWNNLRSQSDPTANWVNCGLSLIEAETKTRKFFHKCL